MLVNPTAGNGRGDRVGEQAVHRLRTRGLRVRSLRGVDGAAAGRLAVQAVRAGVDALVVVGGDGLAHLAVQALAGTTVPLAVVPAGTGNDLARALGVPRDRPLAAADLVADALAAGRVRPLDLLRVRSGAGERPVATRVATRVATVVATGFDSRVTERANAMRWPRGQARYTLATLAELRACSALPYVLDLDGGRVELEAMLVAVANTPSYGGGLRICPDAEPDDGLLDVVVIASMRTSDLLRTYPRLFRGTHVRHPAFRRYRARSVRVATPGVVGYGDGERLGALPLSVVVEPGALRTLAP